MTEPCAYPGEIHSTDRVAVHCGYAEPMTLCGYHASPEWMHTAINGAVKPPTWFEKYGSFEERAR